MAAPPLREYFFGGCRLRSPFPLPSLPAWPGAGGGGVPDVVVSLGEAPAPLADPLWSSPFVQIGRDRSARVTLAAVGTFWLPDGARIVVQPAPGAQAFELETLLLGTVAGILLHQRSLLPLQASCVLLGERAIALAGPAASGKSALAAALVRRGALLVSDGLCVLETSGPSPRVLAGATRARLWPDLLDRLEIPPELRLPTRAQHGKHAVAMPAATAGAWPLQLLVHLAASVPAPEPAVQRQLSLDFLFPPGGLVYQRNLGQLLGNAQVEFFGLTALGRQTARVRLQRTRDLEQLDACADLVLAASGARP